MPLALPGERRIGAFLPLSGNKAPNHCPNSGRAALHRGMLTHPYMTIDRSSLAQLATRA